MNAPSPLRFPLLVVGMLLLVIGMAAGLERLGWNVPLAGVEFGQLHGGLMVCGFLGTLIGLERAVALSRLWTYAGPAATAAAGVGLLLGIPASYCILLMLVGSCLLTAVFVMLYRRQALFHVAFMGLGASLWAVGNGLWLLGWPLYIVTPWWMGFLLFTIAGERLELSRLLRLSAGAYGLFGSSAVVFLLGALGKSHAHYVSDLLPSYGPVLLSLADRILGLGMVMLAGWLLYFDIARRTVRQAGLSRFIGSCLLSGYGWLAGSGLLALGSGQLLAGPLYDGILHAFFIGFVFAMIFGHAPLIFPAVLGLPITFKRLFYLPLLLLHGTLALRLLADLANWMPLRLWAGLANAAAIVLFLLSVVYSMLSSVTTKQPTKTQTGSETLKDSVGSK